MKLFYYRTLIVGLLLSWASLQAQTFTDMSQLLQPGYPLGTKTGQRGASAADYNNDGLVDLYHSNFDSPGRLYLNQGADGFRDVLAEIDLDEGTNMWGAAFGDYDNDGYFDIIFEDLSAPSKLYRNNRNGTFTEVNAAANVAVNTLAQGAAWDDYNLDGKLDLFIVNDVGPNQLFKNLDFQTFTDISISANVQTVGNSYGVSWGDINGDGYPDAYIATCHPNDPLRSINHLLLNNGDETFTNIGQAAGVADSLAGWGVLIFDYDQDGDDDIFSTNSYHAPRPGYNRLYRNEGNNTFSNVSVSAGVAGGMQENSYGCSVADFDNDGWLDIFITNVPQRDRLYHNNGDGTFTDIAVSAGIAVNSHRAGAVADLNNDGWIDIFTAGTPTNKVLFNDGGSNHWIRFRCRGINNNIDGVGARIELYADTLRQAQVIRAGDSFCSQNHSLTAHFGLGQFTVIDSLVVRWPGGQVDKHYGLTAIDRQVTLVEGGGINRRPGSFALLAPADGDTLSGSAQLSWETAVDPDGEALSYSIYIRGYDIWSGALHDTAFSGISATTFEVNPAILRDNYRYRWTVDASDGLLRTASFQAREFIYQPYGNILQLSTANLGAAEITSAGASWGDYDRDGYPDLFVSNTGNAPNNLFRNNGDGSFQQITAGAIVTDPGASFGASWGDANDDGWLDLFVANINNQHNQFYLNNCDGTFTKVTSGEIVNDAGYSTAASWSDYDRDGHLDLFVSNSANGANFLYHNNGDGSFSRVFNGVIGNEAASSFGCSWGDYDNDGDPDLFVANVAKNFLYRNDGNGNFAKLVTGAIVNDSETSRSGSWGDYDNDGDLDLYVINLGRNSLYENNGNGSFSKVGGIAPVQYSRDSRSGHWADYDNDGDLDLFVSNSGDNALYLNNGDKTFLEFQAGFLVNDGTTANGAAAADYDRDGDLDLFVTSFETGAGNYLFTNLGQGNNWLQVHCVGTVSNSSAIGAMLRLRGTIFGSSFWQLREISGQASFASQHEFTVTFGLGDALSADSLRVEWPSGRVSLLGDIAANQRLTVREDSTLFLPPADAPLPESFYLAQNYPNPFNPETVIRYAIPREGRVQIQIFDASGRKVRTLVDTFAPAGSGQVRWNGRNDSDKLVSSGIYFYRLSFEGMTQNRKMLLLH